MAFGNASLCELLLIYLLFIFNRLFYFLAPQEPPASLCTFSTLALESISSPKHLGLLGLVFRNQNVDSRCVHGAHTASASSLLVHGAASSHFHFHVCLALCMSVCVCT